MMMAGIAVFVAPTKRLSDEVADESETPSGGVRKHHVEKLVRAIERVAGRQGKTLE